MPRWPPNPNRVPQAERPDIAWRMRMQNPPASWAAITRACGVSSGNSHSWFMEACEARGLPEDFAWYEWNVTRLSRRETVDEYRQYLTNAKADEIDTRCETYRQWLEWMDLREGRRRDPVCPTCHGLGVVRTE